MPKKNMAKVIPWLIDLVDLEKFGLRWINRRDGKCSIPWPRQLDKKWKLQDSAIFLEYAKMKGYEVNPEDAKIYPRLKHRFAAALKQMGCDKLAKEKDKRIYRFNPKILADHFPVISLTEEKIDDRVLHQLNPIPIPDVVELEVEVHIPDEIFNIGLDDNSFDFDVKSMFETVDDVDHSLFDQFKDAENAN